MSEQTPWHENVGNVAELARFLHEQYDYEVKPLLDMLAKPWKWECEYLEMRAMQKNGMLAIPIVRVPTANRADEFRPRTNLLTPNSGKESKWQRVYPLS